MNKQQMSSLYPRLRLILCLIGAYFLLFREVNLVHAESQPGFGIWVEVEGAHRPFDSLNEFNDFLEYIEKGKFTDIYCQVYRNGKSWFPSMLADDSPYRNARAQGFDPLKDTIRAAHARGQKVYAWVNVLRVKSNRSAPVFRIVGKEAALVDNFGNSLYDYDEEGHPPGDPGRFFKLGTPGIWLDPSHPELRKYLVEIVRDILTAYPKIDGVHLDMIRYPIMMVERQGKKYKNKLQFGYAPHSIGSFYQEEGKVIVDYEQTSFIKNAAKKPVQPQSVKGVNYVPFPGEFVSPAQRKLPYGEDWNDWRRTQVSQLVSEIRAVVNEIAPGKDLSAAVVAWPDRAYSHAMQDWRYWLENRVVDTLVPMSYTKTDSTLSSLTKEVVPYSNERRILMGLGAWMVKHKTGALEKQAIAALRGGADGVVLFSFANLFSSNERALIGKTRATVLQEYDRIITERTKKAAAVSK